METRERGKLGEGCGTTGTKRGQKRVNHATISDTGMERRGKAPSMGAVRSWGPLTGGGKAKTLGVDDSDPITWTSSPVVTVLSPNPAPGKRKRTSPALAIAAKNRGGGAKKAVMVMDISDSDSYSGMETAAETIRTTALNKKDINRTSGMPRSRRVSEVMDVEDDSVIIIPETPVITRSKALKTTAPLEAIPTNSIVPKKNNEKEKENEKEKDKMNWLMHSSSDDEEWVSLSKTAAQLASKSTITSTVTASKPSLGSGFKLSAATRELLKGLRKRDTNSNDEDGVEDEPSDYRPKKRKTAPLNSKPVTDMILSSPPPYLRASNPASVESESVSAPKAKRTITTTTTTTTTTTMKKPVVPEVAAAKEAAKAAKEFAKLAKEAEKARKAAEREDAAALKRSEAELASLNKLKKSKSESVTEMIVDISSSFASTPLGQQLCGFLTHLKCEVDTDYHPTITDDVQSSEKVVKWRRKTTAYWDKDSAMFRPLEREEVKDEKHVLVHLTAKEFMELAVPDSGNLDRHVETIKQVLPGQEVKPIYMIEGLLVLLRKHSNAANRQFRANVQAQMGDRQRPTRSRGGGSSGTDQAYTEDMAERSLLRLQVLHNCLVHQTSCATESAEWISLFTSDISMIPYKAVRPTKGTDTFLGNVKTGVNNEDTFVRMLQEITRVTIPAANGVADRVGCVRGLVEYLEEKGDEAFKDVPTLQTRTGAPSERKVGAALSKRIASVFLGADPRADDV